jgi:mRNA interferase RelE/StbE
LAGYKIKISSAAEKTLRKIPKKDLSKLLEAIKSLSLNVYPDGCRKLEGEEDVFRVRHGHYRIVYEVHKKVLLILILKVGHRKGVYR